jgi:hypothetical protein
VAGVETQIGSSTAGLRLLSLAAALTPLPANAGAWIAPEGGQEIVSSAAGERNELQFTESSAYWEIPIGEQTSVVAAPWVETNYDTPDGWRAEAVVGVKRAIFRSEDTVVALQGSALWLSHPGDDACSEGGAEARVLGGRSFGQTGFFNAELAGRVLEGGCEGARLDLTTGYRPSENWLAMAQIFVDAPVEGEESVKAQLTVVRFGRSGRGIQLGLRARVDGEDLEPAFVVGLWGRPGG